MRIKRLENRVTELEKEISELKKQTADLLAANDLKGEIAKILQKEINEKGFVQRNGIKIHCTISSE